MQCANKYFYVPNNKEEQECYKQQVQQKVTSNIVEITFENMKQLQEKYMIDSQPLFCISCQAAYNHLSTIKQRDSNTIWQCEFCDYVNPIQNKSDIKTIKNNDVFYMLQKLEPVNDEEEQKRNEQKDSKMMVEEQEMNENLDEVDYNDQRTVIFCLDNSGSMSSGSVFKDENGQSKYMSRKSCVEKAIETQIASMQKIYPNRKVGIVLFSKEVLILGDCQSEGIKIDKEGSFEKLFEQGQNNYEKQFKTVVSKVQNMGQRYKECRTNGSTALGPGLAVSLGLASQTAGSSIILCTDGLANEGIGQLEDKKDYKVYERMGQLAKSQGILIHVMTMRGNESDVRVLGQLADTTGGRISRVGPADFNNKFIEVVKSDLIASKAEVVVQLHEGLVMIEGQPHTDLGNVTNNTTLTFQYAIKDNYSFNQRQSIPLQTKIFYQNVKGHKMVRIITQSQNITYEKIQAVQSVQINVLSRHANKMNAQEAQFGSLSKAQEKNQLWGDYMQNNILQHNQSQISEYKEFDQKQKKINGAILRKKEQIEKKIHKQEDMDDAEQDLFDMY